MIYPTSANGGNFLLRSEVGVSRSVQIQDGAVYVMLFAIMRNIGIKARGQWKGTCGTLDKEQFILNQ